MRKPSLKNKRKSAWISLALAVLTGGFLCFQSAIPEPYSANQSNAIGSFIATVVNFFSGDVAAREVEPTGLVLRADSTYLPSRDWIAQIGVGTTTRLQFAVESAPLGKGEYLNPAFAVRRDDGTKDGDDSYRIITDVAAHAVYLVSVGRAMENGAITVQAGAEQRFSYRFAIVDLPAPDMAICHGEVPSSLTLPMHGSYRIPLRLDDGRKHDPYDVDSYLRRYFDTRKIAASSTDERVCSIDEQGVVHGWQEGQAELTYGPWKIAVVVSGSVASPAASEPIRWEQSGAALAINDYDYEASGVRLRAAFDDPRYAPSFSFAIVDERGNHDPLTAKIVRIDERSCYVKGYRRASLAHVRISAASNPDCQTTVTLPFAEIKPIRMGLLVNGEPLAAASPNGATIALPASNASKISLRGVFTGNDGNQNVTNRALRADASSPSIVIAGNDSEILTLSFNGTGAASLTISSLAEPTLRYHLAFSISPALNQDPGDALFLAFVRKFVGHASLFALHAAFLFLFFAALLRERSGWVSASLSLSAAALLAGGTELIQRFTPGRTASWNDIGIDGAGALVGLLVAWVIWLAIKRWKTRKGASAEPRVKE